MRATDLYCASPTKQARKKGEGDGTDLVTLIVCFVGLVKVLGMDIPHIQNH